MTTIDAKKTIADNAVHGIESFIVSVEGYTIGYISGENYSFGHFYYSFKENNKNLFEYTFDNVNDFVHFPVKEHSWLWLTIALQQIKRTK